MITELLTPANYTFSPYAIPTFVTAVALLLLGLTVLVRERISLVSVLFFLMTLTVSVWLFGFSWMYSTTNESVARWWAKAAYLGVPFIPSAIYHFTVVVLRIYQRYKARVWISWTISALFTAAILPTDALHNAMYRYPWGYYPKYGWLGLPFMTFFFCTMLIALHHYWMEYRKAKPGTHKSRIKWLSIAFAGAYIASLDFLPKYGVGLYPLGYLGVFAWLVFVERAIWRYQLVDITPAFAAEPIIGTMADALLVLDHDGILQVTNQAACHLLGRSETELVGKSISTISRDLFPKEKLDTLVRTGALQHYETNYSPRQGWTMVLDISASAIRDRFEQTVGIVCIARDITERKRSEEAVRASEERFRSVTQSANDAIISADSRGIILSWNKGARAIFGYEEAEVRGQPLTLLMPERYRAAHQQGLKRVQAAGDSRVIGTTVELHGLRKDGGEFPLELSLSSWKISGETFFSAIIRDITERKRMEEQLRRKNEELEKQNLKVQEANRLKSEFLANMSHELRTPLNSIIGFSQLMHDGKAGPLRPDQKEYMGDILTSSRHLLQLINDVLDLSKVESGKMEFFPELVEMKALVGEVRDILRSIAGSKRITVKTEVAPDLGAVTIDAAKFKQVLYNYLSNALKFTPDDGQVTVRVTPEGEDRFRLEVEDTGIGIKPDDIGRLFLEFQQLDASTAKKYPGTGLGLALTKRLVEAQSGSVGVRSTYGQGSVFFAVLPRTTYQVQQVERKQTAFPHKGSPKVLVIEDERKDRNWLSKTIGEAGYHVETATTGVEAIMKCREQVFDAIMLDLLLPDMNGRDVLAVIQEEGLNKRTPVIVVTVVSEKGIMAGYDVHDIFQKPVGGQQLLASLKRAGVKPNDSGPVLVVDDDPNMLKLGKRTLEKLGYNPICVESPRGALDMIAQSQPAAVVTDIRFPGTDVFEFLNRLRSTEAGRQIPVIVWTAGDATESLREKLQSSVRAVVLRSQGPAALVQAVQACVPLPATQAQAQKVSRGRRT